MKQILKKLYVFWDDAFDWLMVRRLRSLEIKKFRFPERKAIYEKIQLTPEQSASIDKLYEENYGRIPHTWHRHFTAFTGHFDENYFPELLFIPEFEHFMNYNRAYVDAFSDKNVISALANQAGIQTPRALLTCSCGSYCVRGEYATYDQALSFFANLGEAFIKPSVDSCSGQGCSVVVMHDGVDELSGKGAETIFAELGKHFVVQERIRCEKSIADIYPDSVNTFRVITYRWKGEIDAMPVIMRIGQGKANVDNAHAGGIFVAVSNEGVLGKTAFTEFNMQYTRHPDTKVVFEGHKIDGFARVLESAKRMHAALPQLGVYNWDFTINDAGDPVLIEANTIGGSVWLPQMAHGTGVFGDRLPEVLRWIRMMKKLPKSKREPHYFGM